MGLLKLFFSGAKDPARLLLTRAGPVKNEGRLYSHPGPPLSLEGERAVLALASPLQKAGVRAVYAPDSRPESQAARLLAEALGVPYALYPELRERSWGEWEGLLFEEVREKYPEEVARWAEDEAGFSPPGGESVLEVFARSQPLIKDLLARHPGEAFLLIGNCTVNRAALALALPFLPPGEGLKFEQDYARLSELRFYGEEGLVAYLNR